MSDLELYRLISFTLAALLFGGAGGWYLRGRTLAGIGRPTKPQTGFAWARADNIFVETTRTGETARVVHTTADDLPEGRYLTFCIHDSRTGLDRDVTIPARQVWAFMREENPTQGNVRVRHDTYSQMLSVAKFNRWVTLQGRRYEWEPALGTRERRLRMFGLWCDKGGPA